jgi:hypothetical protein
LLVARREVWSAFIPLRRVGADDARPEANVTRPVRVIQLGDLAQVIRGLSDGQCLVVDATHVTEVPLAQIARLVRLRRSLQVRGGDLILAASPATQRSLRRAGLAFSLRCRSSVTEASIELDDAAQDWAGGR